MTLEVFRMGSPPLRPTINNVNRKSVLVMWDYSAYPLWTSGPTPAERDPSAVPISPSLRLALAEWAQRMEGLMAGSDSPQRDVPSLEDLASANAIGADLAQRVRDELDEFWDVEYHDELTDERRRLFRTGRPVHRSHHTR